jgi:amidohydrolase
MTEKTPKPATIKGNHTMLEQAREIQPLMVQWRRDFHRHPELGFQEHRTAQVLAETLAGMGYQVRTGIGRTGVLARRGTGKPVVGIRADMDALPIQDAKAVSYKSKVDGVMHACGHDAHMAIALGAAKLLSECRLEGAVQFLFQPAEEIQDEDGLSGAPRMIADGAMQDLDCILALHVDASMPTGEVGLQVEFAAAGVDTFKVKLTGKGGHGATPQRVIDPVFISGHVILAIHGIISRRLWPFDPAVISIGAIHAGSASNIIPSEVELLGTIRYHDLEVQATIHEELGRALEIARTLGGDYELEIIEGYPPMENDPGVVALLEQVAHDLVGADRVSAPEPEMGSEDFAYMLQRAPGAMFTLGCLLEGDPRRHHDPRFDIDEACLPVGAAMFAQATLAYLESGELPRMATGRFNTV